MQMSKNVNNDVSKDPPISDNYLYQKLFESAQSTVIYLKSFSYKVFVH